MRNIVAAALAGRYLGYGLPKEAAWQALAAWNRKCRPPLPAQELHRTFESILKRERAKTDPDAAEPAELLALASERLGVQIAGAALIEGEPRKLRLEGQDGHAAEITLRSLARRERLEGAILEACADRPRRLKVDALCETVRLLLCAARQRVIDPGEEATSAGELRDWLQAYLEAMPVRGEGELTSPVELPCRLGKRVCVHAEHLRQFVGARFDVRITTKELVTRLKLAGFDKVRVQVPLPDGERVFRRFWRVPALYQCHVL